jgi:tight adherence protein C
VGEVLRVQAGQVRLVRRQKAREQAAKTPVKILFPVVVGIFPAMFVVTVGPGAIMILRTVFAI